MQAVDIQRLSVTDTVAVSDYFSAIPDRPVIFTDATAQWPAAKKWSFEHIATTYGEDFGIVRVGFGRGAGKATKLGQFLEMLDRPLADVPGFWIESGGVPTRESPEYDDADVWTIHWPGADLHPELRDDLRPYPAAIPNIVANLPDDMFKAVQSLAGYELWSIYMTRRNTVVPMHHDFGFTFGSLSQFVGRKKVFMLAPGDFRGEKGKGPSPESDDPADRAAYAGKTFHTAELQPGEMLIMPPEWWHYTRALDHSLTVSHNFFNHLNFAGYLRHVLEPLRDAERRNQVLEKILKIMTPIPAVH